MDPSPRNVDLMSTKDEQLKISLCYTDLPILVAHMSQTSLWWCTQSYLQWIPLQLPLVTAFLSSGIKLDASGYLLVPISLVFRYGTHHKMALNMHTNSSTHPPGCLISPNFPNLQMYLFYLSISYIPLLTINSPKMILSRAKNLQLRDPGGLKYTQSSELLCRHTVLPRCTQCAINFTGNLLAGRSVQPERFDHVPHDIACMVLWVVLIIKLLLMQSDSNHRCCCSCRGYRDLQIGCIFIHKLACAHIQ